MLIAEVRVGDIEVIGDIELKKEPVVLLEPLEVDKSVPLDVGDVVSRLLFVADDEKLLLPDEEPQFDALKVPITGLELGVPDTVAVIDCIEVLLEVIDTELVGEIESVLKDVDVGVPDKLFKDVKVRRFVIVPDSLGVLLFVTIEVTVDVCEAVSDWSVVVDFEDNKVAEAHELTEEDAVLVTEIDIEDVLLKWLVADIVTLTLDEVDGDDDPPFRDAEPVVLIDDVCDIWLLIVIEDVTLFVRDKSVLDERTALGLVDTVGENEIVSFAETEFIPSVGEIDDDAVIDIEVEGHDVSIAVKVGRKGVVVAQEVNEPDTERVELIVDDSHLVFVIIEDPDPLDVTLLLGEFERVLDVVALPDFVFIWETVKRAVDDKHTVLDNVRGAVFDTVDVVVIERSLLTVNDDCAEREPVLVYVILLLIEFTDVRVGETVIIDEVERMELTLARDVTETDDVCDNIALADIDEHGEGEEDEE